MKSLKNLSIILIVTALSAFTASAKTNGPLTDHFKNGQYKIIQFTDIHWVESMKSCNDSTLELMSRLIAEEKPNIAVLTGDIVTWNKPAEALSAWTRIARFFNDRKLPFIVTFGNHDAENDTLTNRTIMNFLASKTKYSLTRNDEENLSGQGNCCLRVLGDKSDSIKWNLFFFDSHDYARNKSITGTYGWIEYDQIAWYRQLSEGMNAGRTEKIPALAFFHIPLPEFIPADSSAVYGNIKDTGRGAPELNSGLLYSFIKKGDVIGVFCGHDHNDDYDYVYDGICLSYGRKTGFNEVYPEVLKRGARIIVLHENEPIFDTYIVDEEGHSLDFTFGKK